MKRSFLTIAFFVVLSANLVAGEPAGKRYVIIHADDAGMSHSVNVATIQALEEGIVSSTSIMVPCPWFPEFAAYAKEHPEKDYGIHLTLNAEWDHYRWGPVAPRDKVPSLVDDDGYLWDNTQQVAANAKAEEVAVELRAQVLRAKKFGVPLSHLDTHMGSCLVRPDLIEVYIKLGLEFDLPVLFMRPTEGSRVLKEYPAAARFVPLLDKNSMPILDDVFQFYDRRPHEERMATYLETLRTLKPGVREIIIHCGLDNQELRAITSSVTTRADDRRIFTDPEVMAEVKKMGVEVITWKKFRAMNDAKTASR